MAGIKISSKVDESVWLDLKRLADESHQNLSGLLTENEFVDNSEHYTREGNRKIALALAPAVEESLNR